MDFYGKTNCCRDAYDAKETDWLPRPRKKLPSERDFRTDFCVLSLSPLVWSERRGPHLVKL